MNNRPQQRAILALADGTIFRGTAFGAAVMADEPTVGEVVFNTSLYGYQEILTDPSYAGQIMCFTYPHIGNVGCNPQDIESAKVHARGVLVRDLSRTVSNFRSTQTLDSFLRDHNTMGLSGLDTRELVMHLRDKGSQMGAMALDGPGAADLLVEHARKSGSMLGRTYVDEVSCKEPYSWDQLPWSLETNSYRHVPADQLWSKPHVVALDCGIKYNILRLLLQSGFRVTVAPARSTREELLALAPDALFLSNGPGDPAVLTSIVSVVKSLLGKLPIFGICLGHQILAQAYGAETYKLKFGHRGGNHPVLDQTTGKVEITVQNHGFAVSVDTFPKSIQMTHINLNDRTVEGLAAPQDCAFSIQYHPESSPGPHDAQYLFQRFFESVVGYRKGGR